MYPTGPEFHEHQSIDDFLVWPSGKLRNRENKYIKCEYNTKLRSRSVSLLLGGDEFKRGDVAGHGFETRHHVVVEQVKR